MKITLIAASAVLAVTAAASADVKIDFGSGIYAGGDSQSYLNNLYGTLTGFSIDFDFASNDGGASWAADAALVLNGSQWGGYDIYLSTATNYQGSLIPGTSGLDGHYGAVINLNPSVWNGEALKVEFGNGWSASAGATYANVTVTLFGVSKVPGPGAAALLGLAGLAGSRRRRA